MFESLPPKPDDPLLAIIGLFASDTRDHKIDLGVGVYREPDGRTPVMRAVKLAEQRLIEEQVSKSYLGLAGDVEFVERLQNLAFGEAAAHDRTVGVQTPGGSGALRLGTELIHLGNPDARVWLGNPSWGNHAPIFTAVGCRIENYRYFDVATQTLQFDTMAEALSSASAGDVVLLQGCCHNPTGADLSLAQWEVISDICCTRGLLPLIDIAYQGLGDGLASDLVGVNALLSKVPEAVVTVSCSKNFGLYRERTGALYVLCDSAASRATASSNVMALARVAYSMPPDHGAAVVRTILADDELTTIWHTELAAMQQRVQNTRQQLVQALGSQHLYLAEQKGMFSTLNLSAETILELREHDAIYMAGDGRINVAGFGAGQIERFATCVAPRLAVFG